MKKLRLKEEARCPLFLLCVLTLILSSGIIRLARLDSLAQTLFAAIILQGLVFGIPLFLYMRYTEGARKLILLKRMKLEDLPFAVVLTFTAALGTLILNACLYIVGIKSSSYTTTASFTLSGIPTDTNFFYVILAFALIPAILEEFIFRGIIYGEYAKRNDKAAMIISTLAFAMSRFDIASFLPHLFMGLILAFALKMTKSIWTCVIIHFFCNILSVYFLPGFWNVITQPMGILFAIFIVTALFAIFFISVLYMSERRLMKLAVSVPETDVYDKNQTKQSVKEGFKLLIRPQFIICELFFLVSSIIIYFAQ